MSKSTIDDLWQRHFLDSAQLLQHIKPTDRVVDFGSGAGFPAMVLAIMGVASVTAIESDQRKVAFLREVARVTKTNLTILNMRIEQAATFPVDVITARAFASLESLLNYAQPWWQLHTKGVFLKGANVKEELTAAQLKWHIKFSCMTSQTDPVGSLLIIEKAEAITT